MEVSAKLTNASLSPQKGRLIADQIRGKNVENALQILTYSNKKAAQIVKKVLKNPVQRSTKKIYCLGIP